MTAQTTRRRPLREGSAYMLALMLLVVFSALAAAMATTSNLSLQKSSNHRSSSSAQLTAESGMEFLLERLSTVRLPASTTEASFPANLKTALDKAINASNLANQSIVSTTGGVAVPAISAAGGSFTSSMLWSTSNRCRLTVRGAHSGVARTIRMDVVLIPKNATAFDYGLASRGPITISGNATITGVNNPQEASVVSSTTAANAITVDGNVVLSGDLGASAENANVAITGHPSIAGSTDPAVYSQHIHFGVAEPDFPEINIAPLAALANGIVIDSHTNTSGALVFNNARIKAGTNPTFSSKVTINGVLLVEAPNVVKFEGQTVLNGFVAAENTSSALSDCQLRFSGGVEAYGVDALPASDPQFTAVRQKSGTFIVAPGFGVTFGGNFSTINGSIAADQLTFTGTAEGTVKGSVIGLKDLPTFVGGNVDIRVDRKGADANPTGFLKPYALKAVSASYAEVTGG